MKTYTVQPTQTQRAQLTALRAKLATLLAAGTKATSTANAKVKERDRIARELEELENTKIVTDATANALCVKRERLRMLEKQIQADTEPGGVQGEQLAGVLLRFRPVFRAVMDAVHRQLVRDILGSLRPWYIKSHLTEHLCQNTDAMRSFGNFISRQWGLEGGPFSQAKAAIAIIDKFMVGQSPWQLDQ